MTRLWFLLAIVAVCALPAPSAAAVTRAVAGAWHLPIGATLVLESSGRYVFGPMFGATYRGWYVARGGVYRFGIGNGPMNNYGRYLVSGGRLYIVSSAGARYVFAR